ncbi:dihydroorotate dehydrogenase [Thermococcus sp.]|uniref:iron-sulfur cluster-binding protein n=1 Tax=Thermococcus sp. TaxID=35749 RepID=UPI001987E298|nr:dihydroorotate dehydrogenase [Thermococcus sp.]MBC7094882.1 dihydroorotate dehydrogenase [Thermococcus sp.]
MIEGIIKDRKVAGNDYLLTIELSREMDKSEPGQFVMLKLGIEPILAKPFSILDHSGSRLRLYIKQVGRLTTLLKEAPIGSKVLVRGPYGVPYINKINLSKKYILVGGGTGAAPLMYFAKKYPHLVFDQIYGFSNSEIRTLFPGYPINISKETGKHTVDIAKEIYENNKDKNLGIIACGPKGMLKKIASIFGNVAYISLEENMGCGIGVCEGCPVKTKDGIKFVCKDGPLFNASEVIWEW